ncbi:hypothetical protein HPT25_22660 [Bacillus sp. BRMEA1]|uniref:hypothetical protein n=1 Tax=Neobacillus endophyticus TaxID=2738405 RepID=UPI0015672322|nr:hypothetical protein [Neobacillus endophyticus]NRD80143.1 hypothetical protein [Neobacillus endophyticus]
MGKELIAIAFFKDRKLNYYLDSLKKAIVFPCLACGKQADMDIATTRWSCDFCQQKGNLATLITIQVMDAAVNTAIFNPKKEWYAIKRRFNKLSQRHGQEMLVLLKKVEELVKYYEGSK